MNPDRPQHHYLNQLKAIVLQNLGNEQFGVEGLAEAAGISRSQLHRKLKRMLHKTVNDFIREVRLDEALKLLETEDLTAAEISYRVGFSSPSYFNKCFHDQFGYTPGEVKKKLEEGLPLSELGLQSDTGDPPSPSPMPSAAPLRMPDARQQPTDVQAVETKRKRSIRWMRPALIIAVLLGVTAVLLIFVLRDSKPVSTEPSIAVLAFEDRSPTQDQEYLGEGMAEEIMNILSGVEPLKVIARSSAFRFKGQNIDIREVGKQLEVKHLVEGSIMKVGDRLRVTVQLVETSGGTQVWSEVYDREMKDIFSIQNSIALLVVKNMQSQLIDDSDIRPRAEATQNMEAYNLNLKGDHFLNEHLEWAGPEANPKAINCFKAAIELDPSYAEPYAGLAWALLNHVSSEGPNNTYNPLIDSARATVARALSIDNNLAKAYIVKGMIHLWYDWDWSEADEAFAKGVKLQPKGHWVRFMYPYFLNAMERYEESIAFLKETIELDPVSPISYSQLSVTADIADQPELGTEMMSKAQELDPKSRLVIGIANSHYTYLKDREGFERIRKVIWVEDLSAVPSFFLSFQIIGLARLGSDYFSEVTRYFTEMNRRYKEAGMDHYYMFTAYMSIGDFDKAMECLEKAYEAREALLVHLRYHWMFESIRADRRFQDIVQRIDRGGP